MSVEQAIMVKHQQQSLSTIVGKPISPFKITG